MLRSIARRSRLLCDTECFLKISELEHGRQSCSTYEIPYRFSRQRILDTLDSGSTGKEPLKSYRHFSTSARVQSNAFHAVTGYSFAGKPRTQKAEEEMQQKMAGSAPTFGTSSISKESVTRQGFSSTSTIGRWVEVTLKQGEAGEDAILFEKMKGNGDIAFGVSDGVGGWSEEGIDPALFSQSLMYHSAQYAKNCFACPERLESDEVPDSGEEAVAIKSDQNSDSILDGTPSRILEYAYQKTLQQKEVPAGSATACILTFDASKGILRAANLGDSGFLILRPAIGGSEVRDDTSNSVRLIIHYQSKPQVFGFNAPYQLSKLPIEYQSDNQIDCTPKRADLYKDGVLDGDLVLVATDGFWDNVSVKEILPLVQFIKDKHRAAFVDKMLDISHNPLAEEEDLANVLAHNLLSYALLCQFSTNKKSPFEREAARHGIRYPGGKVDDVAIVVSIIVER